MRLSEYSDYSLRVLMHCALHTERLLTIGEIADALQVSKNHLMKIVNDLAHQGLLQTTRGRGGGIRLCKAPETIRIGDVLRHTETDFRVVECFDAATDRCTLTPVCRLKNVLGQALKAWFAPLDAVTLADMALPLAAPPRAGPVPVALPVRRPGSKTLGTTGRPFKA